MCTWTLYSNALLQIELRILQGQTAATVCQACEAGKYSSVLGASTCEDCDIGYISEQGAVYCTPCDSGNIFTSDSCESCALGQVKCLKNMRILTFSIV